MSKTTTDRAGKKREYVSFRKATPHVAADVRRRILAISGNPPPNVGRCGIDKSAARWDFDWRI
jgi:hypothetical protein